MYIESESDSGSGMEPDNYDVRLVGGPDQYTGLLEVFFNGVWGTICRTSFNDSAAQVVCKQLGYLGGVAAMSTPYGRGEGVVWLENVQCSGAEENLSECSHSSWGEHSCFPIPHMWDVNVQCQGKHERICRKAALNILHQPCSRIKVQVVCHISVCAVHSLLW